MVIAAAPGLQPPDADTTPQGAGGHHGAVQVHRFQEFGEVAGLIDDALSMAPCLIGLAGGLL